MWLWLWVAVASAARPTSGGMFAFSEEDVLATYEESSGRVRVTFSTEGPNRVRAGDVDADGTPDFAQDVAETAAEVLDRYAELGFRTPLSEADMGLESLGGSSAFDFYLVDFGGSADGYFGTDACTDAPRHCSGFMVMENDFAGYGYPSTHEAIAVLTSHELFHAVQSAYDAGSPGWFSEGTAVWAERQFDEDVLDFFWFADAYLEDSGRSLDRPPTGPVPAFAYGTALWWDFLTLRHDPSWMVDMLEAVESPDGAEVDYVEAMLETLEARGDAIAPAWTTFADENLATGDRAGTMVSVYPYAARLSGVEPAASGASIDEDHRFYPLAASYFHLEHPGGPVAFAAERDAESVRFLLHPVVGNAEDGPVADDIARFAAIRERVDLGDLPAGGYWLVGTHAAVAQNSEKFRFCLGSPAMVAACFPEGAGVAEGESPEVAGCGCAAGGSGAGWGLAGAGMALGAWTRRRRSAPA
jgi:MYXO-CTERM domain-containing protein